MEIILKEDVVNLGYKNDIVTVKSGYGRNYLIPTGKAVIASPSAKKMLAEELKQRAHKLEKIKKDAEAASFTTMIFLSISWPNLANSSAIWMLPTEPKIVPVELTFVAIVNDTPSNLAATASASFLIFSSL